MFLRLGRSGYQQVLGDCWRVSSALGDLLTSTGAFDVVSPRAPEPGVALVAFRLSASRRRRGYDEHDVSDGLRERGWIVPAYPLPAGTEEEDGRRHRRPPLVLRVVCRADLSFGLAATLASDVARALERLEAREAKDRELGRRGAGDAGLAVVEEQGAREEDGTPPPRRRGEAEELESEGRGARRRRRKRPPTWPRRPPRRTPRPRLPPLPWRREGMRHGGVC